MKNSTAIFACSDIVATLDYYKDVLGFESAWTWGEPPTFGSASKGGATIMFSLQPELAKNIRGHQHWINVDDPDELYKQHRANGAKIVSEIEDKPWGFREYTVEDPSGYHLRIAGPPSTAPVKSQPFPEGVTIARRKPTQAEFDTLAGGAFGYKEAGPSVLEHSWGGVVALSPEGGAIGMVRIMQDAPGWYSIWDVAVAPEWQAHRIGSAMMREALATIREERGGAIVYLFTYKHGFYERLGFNTETVSMLRL